MVRMPLSRSWTIPALLALATAVSIGGFLLWQLDHARALLQGGRSDVTESGSSLRIIAPLPTPAAQGDTALAALRRGDVLALRGEWTEAERAFTESVEAGGGLTALRKLAQAQLQRRDIVAVRDTLRRLHAAGARAEDVLLLESIIHLRSGELDDARQLLEGSDESPQKQYGLALLAIVEERHEDAQHTLSTVLAGWEPTLRGYARTLLAAYEEYAVFSESPATHRSTLLARALADVGECELALPLLQRVLAVQDDYRDAWIVRGYCQLTTERLDEARASFERAYAIDPQKADIQYFLARTLSRLGDHQGAITYFQYALQNGFTPASEAHRLLAAEAFAIGDAQTGLQELTILTRDPSASIASFVDAVTAALSMEKNEEAYAFAQEAVARFPDDAQSHDLLGWTAIETNRIDEARSALMHALELNPSLERARDRLHSL